MLGGARWWSGRQKGKLARQHNSSLLVSARQLQAHVRRRHERSRGSWPSKPHRYKDVRHRVASVNEGDLPAALDDKMGALGTIAVEIVVSIMSDAFHRERRTRFVGHLIPSLLHRPTSLVQGSAAGNELLKRSLHRRRRIRGSARTASAGSRVPQEQERKTREVDHDVAPPNGSRLSCGASAGGRKRLALRYRPAGAETFASAKSRPRQLQALVRPRPHRRGTRCTSPVVLLTVTKVPASRCTWSRRRK